MQFYVGAGGTGPLIWARPLLKYFGFNNKYAKIINPEAFCGPQNVPKCVCGPRWGSSRRSPRRPSRLQRLQNGIPGTLRLDPRSSVVGARTQIFSSRTAHVLKCINSVLLHCWLADRKGTRACKNFHSSTGNPKKFFLYRETFENLYSPYNDSNIKFKKKLN